MQLNKLVMKNFKKFRRFQLDAGTKNVLTGRNNAGKSSILDALGSRLIEIQSQKMTVAARATAERKTMGHRS